MTPPTGLSPRPTTPHRAFSISGFLGPAALKSGAGERRLSRRAVRVRPADRGVAHAFLDPAMLALDPDPGGQVPPVPGLLATPRAGLRMRGAHHGAPNVALSFNLSEPLPRPSSKGCLRLDLLPASLGLDGDRVADRPLAQRLDEVRDSCERFASEGDDHVPDLEPRGLRGGARRDLCGEDAMAAR